MGRIVLAEGRPGRQIRRLAGPTEGASERSLAEVIWRRRWVALAGFLLGVAGALAYGQWAPREYTSMALLQIEANPARGLGREPNISDVVVDGYRNTQAQVLVSRPLLTATLAQPEVRDLPMWEKIGDRTRYLQEHVDAQTGKKDELVTVVLRSPRAEDGAKVLQALLDNYLAWQTQQTASVNSGMVASLQQEKFAQQAELAKRRKALLDFKAANEVVSFESDKSNVVLERLAKLSEAMTVAQLAAIEADAKLKSAEVLRKDAAKLRQFAVGQSDRGVTVTTDTLHDSMLLELSHEKAQAAALGRRVTPEHPEMRALKASITKLEAAIAEDDKRFVENYMATLEENSVKAHGQYDATESVYKSQARAALEMGGKAAEYAQLEAAFKQVERVCLLLEERIRDLQVSNKGPDWVMRVIEPPTVALKPSSPRRAHVLGAGVGLGLILGILLAVVRELRDPRLRSSEEIGEAAGLPVLGSVPHLRRRDRVRVAGVYTPGDACEAFRTVRASLYCAAGWESSRTILVTSAAAGEGKSTLVSNLAENMASSGRRVLIVDGDFRRPMQQTIFGLTAGLGLQDVLTAQAPWQDAVQHTKNPLVDLLSAGSMAPTAPDRLCDQTFPRLLGELAAQYHHVLVDSPPLAMAEARVLARHCGAVILVARAGRTTRQACQRACQGLANAGAAVLGIVVNDAPRRSVEHGYCYAYAQHGGAAPADSLDAAGMPRRGEAVAALPHGSERSRVGDASSETVTGETGR